MAKDRILAQVEGKAVVHTLQGVIEAFWGTTQLELESLRIVERTKFLFNERETQILLVNLSGVQFASRPNPALMVLGFLTLPLLGAGLIFLFLASLLRRKFLIVSAPGLIQALRAKGDAEQYERFMDSVMAQSEKVTRRPAEEPRGEASPAAAPAERSSAATAQVRSLAGNTVRCPSCNTDFSVPAGPPGRRFRCPNCKEVVNAAR